MISDLLGSNLLSLPHEERNKDALRNRADVVVENVSGDGRGD